MLFSIATHTMKPITWLRRLADRGDQGYPFEFQARGIPYVRVPLDIEEVKQFCEEQGIANDGKARAALAARKAEQYPNVEN